MRGRVTKAIVAIGLTLGLLAAAGPAGAAANKWGATGEERAVNGAKAYLKKIGKSELNFKVLTISLFTKAFKDLQAEFKQRTGIGVGEYIEIGYTELHGKVMAEAVAGKASYDIIMGFPQWIPDFAGAKVIIPITKYVKEYDPELDGYLGLGARWTQYRGDYYGLNLDDDIHVLILRRDLVEHTDERAAFKARYGYELACPSTWNQYLDQMAFFTRKRGEKLAGQTLDKDFYGGSNPRALDFLYRGWLPMYYSKGKLPFDKDMKPTLVSPEALEATRDFIAMNKYMHNDIKGWATPQVIPFFVQGNAYSQYHFPGIIHPFLNAIPEKILTCASPGYVVAGKFTQFSGFTAGTGFMITRKGAHSEAAYLLAQFFASEGFSPKVVTHPNSFWDPFRKSHFDTDVLLKDPRWGKAKQFLQVQRENILRAGPMINLEGGTEYHKIFDENIHEAMLGNLAVEEALKRIVTKWERVTEDVGRKRQSEAWRALVRDQFPPELAKTAGM